VLNLPNNQNNKIIPLPSYEEELEDPDDYTRIYLLFTGALQYPTGGWYDFKGHFSTIEQAVNFLNKEVDIYEREWFQIVNIETREVVMSK
jgi:hypothetical protein